MRESGVKIGYAKPKQQGGVLIREVVQFLKAQKVKLPITSHILIAQSAGSDSTALATLIAKYGRKVGQTDRIQLTYVNHGWRPDEAKKDESFVRSLGRKLGVKVKILRIPGKPIAPGASWEEEGRTKRRELLAREARKLGPDTLILTAHHADDLAETALWRLFTGSSDTHGGGILAQNGNKIRPFLRVRKKALQKFLAEEEQDWREDHTNHEGRFLRSKMRAELMPNLEKLFPKAVTHLVNQALAHQAASSEENRIRGTEAFESSLFSLTELKLRRPHWLALRSKLQDKDWTGEIHLPEGWKLVKGKV